MSEKIAFAPWGYISLICFVHRDELILDVFKGRPIYRCSAEDCGIRISSALYEKILDDVILFQNQGKLIVGACWRRRSESKIMEFIVTACANGKRPEIAVRIL